MGKQFLLCNNLLFLISTIYWGGFIGSVLGFSPLRSRFPRGQNHCDLITIKQNCGSTVRNSLSSGVQSLCFLYHMHLPSHSSRKYRQVILSALKMTSSRFPELPNDLQQESSNEKLSRHSSTPGLSGQIPCESNMDLSSTIKSALNLVRSPKNWP